MNKLLIGLMAFTLSSFQMHAMEMGTAKNKSSSNNCGNMAKACCMLWLTASANAAHCLDTIPETTECTAMQGNPCTWNPQYQSVHQCTFMFNDREFTYAQIWDDRLGHVLEPDDCDRDGRKGTISHVLKGVYARRDRLRMRECQDLYDQVESDRAEIDRMDENLLACQCRTFSSEDQKIRTDIKDRDKLRAECQNKGIYPKQKQD